MGKLQGFATLGSAREALAEWIRLQRQAGEVVVEQHSGQWHDSRVTTWIADETGAVLRLEG